MASIRHFFSKKCKLSPCNWRRVCMPPPAARLVIRRGHPPPAALRGAPSLYFFRFAPVSSTYVHKKAPSLHFLQVCPVFSPYVHKGGHRQCIFFRFAPVSGTYVHKGGTVNIFILVDAPVFGWVGANFGGKGANFDGKGAKICRQKGAKFAGKIR